MSKVAIAALVFSALLAVLGNRWTNEPAGGGFVMVSFTPVYLLLQWIGFVLALGGLLYYVSRWQATGQVPRMLLVAAILVLFYVVEGVPITWDAKDWKMRNVFADRRRARAEAESLAAALPRFQGAWKSPEASYEFRPDSLVIRRNTHSETISTRTCEFGYKLNYRMSTVHVFPVNGQTNPYLEGLDFSLEYPLLEAGCGNRDYTFLIRPDGKMAGYFMSEIGKTHVELLTR